MFKTSIIVSIILLSLPIQALDAPMIYQQYCAQCHGGTLQGGNAQSLVDGIWNFGAGSSSMRRNIKHGITHMGMPAYENTLSDKEIHAVTEYILDTAQSTGAERPPLPTQVQSKEYEIRVEQWIEDLETPWAIAFLDHQNALITERPGRLRLVIDGKLNEDPIQDIPIVLAEGQGGLLDVAVDPAYEDNGWVYLAYSHALPSEGGKNEAAMTRIERGRIEGNIWVDEEVVFEAAHEHYLKTRVHYGSRIVFDTEGHLYFSIGDRGLQKLAQVLDRPNGKVHRIHRDGSIPDTNPFVDTKNALPSIFSYGNRNPQGLAIHPDTGALWSTEHGPMGGDELNLIRPGLNYGWPVVTYGRNYNGSPVSDIQEQEGMESPVLYWNPSIAVCGLDFYTGAAFEKWHGHLLVGALRYEEVQLVTIVNDRAIHNETILKNAGRVRDLCVGPDGYIYVVLNGPDCIIRLIPESERSY